MNAAYQLREVRRAYDGRTVLDIGRLEIFEGEILAVVGPSGAGKSTLLRLLALLERPSAGELIFKGQAVGEQIPLTLRRQVTLVFQRPLLFNRSVAGNVAYGLRARGLPADGAVAEALRMVGLERLAGKPARKLSGGEIQRVALARALAVRPSVLLLDEPTAHLDPYNVGAIETIIRELSGATPETTIVLVTHNVFQARRLAHRTGLLLDGQLVEVGETGQVFTDPRDPRTAAFVRGEMAY